MRQAKIHWGGHPPQAKTARADAVTEAWAQPAALYTGLAGLGLAAGAMLIAAGLARQPDIGAVRAPPVPAAETLPAPAERPAAPAVGVAQDETDERLTEPAAALADTSVETPVAARFGTIAGEPAADPPFAAAAAPEDARPDPGLAAFAGGDAPASRPAAATDPVEVAETEAEVLAIETRLAAQGDPNFVLPSASGTEPGGVSTSASSATPEPDQPVETVAASQAGLPAAWAREHVNLRAGPDNDATILAIIPGNAALFAEEGCEHWCAAVYEGQSGFVYKSFIRREAP